MKSSGSGCLCFVAAENATNIASLHREEDSLNARVYLGKITIGEYNVAYNRIVTAGQKAFFGDVRYDSDGTSKQASAEVGGTKPSPNQQRPQTATIQSSEPRLTRLALVIGNSNYTDLPRLKNPANDAHAIVDALRDVG